MPQLDREDFTRLIGLRSPIDPPNWELVIDETGLRFAVQAALPLMAYVTTLVLAPGGFVAAGIALPEPWLVWVGAAMAFVATTVLVALRKREVRLGPFAEWKRDGGRFLLQRLQVEIEASELHGLQLLHAHQVDGQGNPLAQISELHLIVRSGEDALLRYPLVAWNPRSPIKELAERVATELDLPLREWRFGRQQGRESIPWPRARGPYPAEAFSKEAVSNG